MNRFTTLIKSSFTLFGCTLFVYPALQAQENGKPLLEKQFNSYRQNALQEKIFVHTDKHFYLAGEILWMKLYDVDATFHKPLNMSKVGYVELLDTANKPVLQAKIALDGGKGSGSFYLPVSISSGIYKLRAYSNWMKNYSADYFFEKTITVFNTQKVTDMPAQQAKADYRLQFFPEGGNLVNNIKSKVAFKLTDRYGKAVNCTGAVLNERQDTVARFQSLQFGMGNFSFIPGSGSSYRAVLQTADHHTVTGTLPEVYKEGYVMRVEETAGNQLKIKVECNIPQAGEVYLLAHTRLSLKEVSAAVIQNGTVDFILDKDKLGDGISHLTIFNSKQQPVCERLYFKYPTAKLAITTAAGAVYSTRKKVDLAIETSDENAVQQPADLSMAVYRLDSLQGIEDNSISSYLWLSSDIKGTVESPGWYFDSASTNAAAAMDNLLLTQGWRRFNWQDILAGNKPLIQFIPEYKGHIVTGRLFNSKTGEPGNNIEGFASVPAEGTKLSVAHSDAQGLVKFEMKEMFGSSQVVLQTNPRDSIYKINANNPFSEMYSANPLPSFELPVKQPGTLLDQSISMQVQNIYEGDKLKQFYPGDMDTNAFYLTANAGYLLDNYTRFTTMEEVLREYVQLILVRKKGSGFHLNIYDLYTKSLMNSDAMLLVDGVPVFNTDKFMSYDPLKIRKLEVVNSRYYLGGSFFEGILNWTTYKPDPSNYELYPQATVLDYEGLQLQREFYMPVYDNDQQVKSRLPDYRNVLYWNPAIVTGLNGKQQVNFYTSDLPGKYAIVLQGITANGKCGSQVKLIEVK